MPHHRWKESIKNLASVDSAQNDTWPTEPVFVLGYHEVTLYGCSARKPSAGTQATEKNSAAAAGTFRLAFTQNCPHRSQKNWSLPNTAAACVGAPARGPSVTCPLRFPCVSEGRETLISHEETGQLVNLVTAIGNEGRSPSLLLWILGLLTPNMEEIYHFSNYLPSPMKNVLLSRRNFSQKQSIDPSSDL